MKLVLHLRSSIMHLWYLQAPTFVTYFSLKYIANRSGVPNWQHICRTCILARHLSLGSLMVRASHRSSEGCGFNPRLGVRNRFPEVWTWQTFIYHQSKFSPMKLLGTPGRGVTTVGMKEYVPLSEDCAPPGVPHLKLGKNYGSNTVAS